MATKLPKGMPTLRFDWEGRLFTKYFKVIVLRGKRDCTFWEYMVEMYHYKFLQAGAFGCVSLLLGLLLVAGVWCQVPLVLLQVLFVLTFSLAFFTGTCILDTRATRRRIMEIWDEEHAGKPDKSLSLIHI